MQETNVKGTVLLTGTHQTQTDLIFHIVAQIYSKDLMSYSVIRVIPDKEEMKIKISYTPKQTQTLQHIVETIKKITDITIPRINELQEGKNTCRCIYGRFTVKNENDTTPIEYQENEWHIVEPPAKK